MIDGGGTVRRCCAACCCPAIVPAIVTVALFAFITSWNEFLGALVLMSKESVVHAAGDPRPPHGPRRAWAARTGGCSRRASSISIIPCVLFYLLLQRYYVSGLTSGAVK